MKSLIPHMILYKDGFSIRLAMKIDMPLNTEIKPILGTLEYFPSMDHKMERMWTFNSTHFTGHIITSSVLRLNHMFTNNMFVMYGRYIYIYIYIYVCVCVCVCVVGQQSVI